MKKRNTLIQTIETNHKKWAISGGLFLTGLMIGMTLSDIDTIKQILVNTISGLIVLLPWFILIFSGFKMISNSILNVIKKIPEWIELFYKKRLELLKIERAVASK